MYNLQEYVDSFKEHRYRIRTVPRHNHYGYTRRYFAGNVLSSSSGFVPDGFLQETMSLYHPGWQDLIHRMKNIGGPFFTRKLTLTTDSHPYNLVSIPGDSSRFEYRGSIFPSGYIRDICVAIRDSTLKKHAAWTSDNALSVADLQLVGSELYLSCIPTTPTYRAATALGELTQALALRPPGTKVLGNDDPGGEYLNYQFGIAPTWNDYQNAVKAAEDSAKILKQWHADAGKDIIRRREIPESTTVEVTTTSPGTSPPMGADGKTISAYLQTGGSVSTKKTIRRRVWFEGAFRYYIPKDVDTWAMRLFELNRVHGVIFTPLDMWNLIPFSWLSDWFTNADSSIHSLFAAGIDGSALIRGYVMCHTHVTTEYEWTGYLKIDGIWTQSSVKWSLDEEIKQRYYAGAYGTRFTGAELSAKQLAILTALGISRRG